MENPTAERIGATVAPDRVATRLDNIASVAEKQGSLISDISRRLTDSLFRQTGPEPQEADSLGDSPKDSGILNKISMTQDATEVTLSQIVATIDRLEQLG